jgi:hypothetical protein
LLLSRTRSVKGQQAGPRKFAAPAGPADVECDADTQLLFQAAIAVAIWSGFGADPGRLLIRLNSAQEGV